MGGGLLIGPLNIDLFSAGRKAPNETVLGKITRPGLQALRRRSGAKRTQNGPYPVWVFLRASESHSDARQPALIVEELCFAAILRHNEIDPAVLVKISRRTCSLLTVDGDAAFSAA